MKKMIKSLKDFWKDDSGLDEHTTRLVYGAAGLVVAGLVVTSIGLLARNKFISLGQDANDFRINVNTTNAANQSNTVGYNSGTTTVTTVNVQ